MPDNLAMIVLVPSERDEAIPFEPDILLIVTEAGFVELQITDEVISAVSLSLYVPMAVNCWFFPKGKLVVTGMMSIDSKTAAVTVRVAAVEVTPEYMAVISATPTDTDEASPFEPAALLMVATAVFDELQVAHVVRSCDVLSARLPAAVNCCFVPLGISWLEGLI